MRGEFEGPLSVPFAFNSYITYPQHLTSCNLTFWALHSSIYRRYVWGVASILARRPMPTLSVYQLMEPSIEFVNKQRQDKDKDKRLTHFLQIILSLEDL